MDELSSEGSADLFEDRSKRQQCLSSSWPILRSVDEHESGRLRCLPQMFFRRAGELSDKLLTVAIVLWIKLDRCDDHKNAPLGAILHRRAPNSRAPGQRMTEITTHTPPHVHQ